MVRLDPWGYVAGAALILMLPIQWLLGAVIAAAIHELCHLAAIQALGGRVLEIRIRPAGAVMETELRGRGRELLAALAGPAGSFLLAFLCRRLPHIAICAALQGIFNLLPLYPLDGGRALRCGLEGVLSARSFAILEGVLTAVIAVLLLRFSAVFAIIFLIRGLVGKIPCKGSKIGVQ